MPELPEVETIRQDLRLKILGLPIIAVEVRRPRMVRGDTEVFTRHLLETQVVEIGRVGKLLLFALASGNFLAVHLKMTGQLLYRFGSNTIAGGHTFPPVDTDLPSKHSHIFLSFQNGSTLYFNDMRMFGYMSLLDSAEEAKTRAAYGPEPGTIEFSVDYLWKCTRTRGIAIKAVLLDQKIVAGIGNIYADETCFLAGIRPNTPAKKLTKKQVERIVAAANSVIAHAVRERGTTFNDYRDPEGRKGNFSSFLQVYGRGGKPCVACGTILKKISVAGRGTVYCSVCQK